MSRLYRLARRREEEARHPRPQPVTAEMRALAESNRQAWQRKVEEVEWLIPQFLARKKHENYPGIIVIPESSNFGRDKTGWIIWQTTPLYSNTTDENVVPSSPYYLTTKGKILRGRSFGKAADMEGPFAINLDPVIAGLREYVDKR